MRKAWSLSALFLAACAACESESPAKPDASTGGASATGATGGWGWDSGTGGGTGGSPGGSGGAGGSGGTTADGGWPVDPSVWKTPAWNPPGCNFLQATDPVKAVPPTPWAACDNGVAGCQMLDTSLVPGESGVANRKFGALNHAVRQNGSTYFSGVLALGTYDHAATVYALDATPLAVWRAPDTLTGCTLAESTFGADGGVSSRSRYRVGPGESAVRIIYGELATLLGANPTYLDMDKSVTGLELFTVSHVRFTSTTLAFETGLSPHVYVWDYSGKPVQIPRPTDVSDQFMPSVVGSEVVFSRYGTPTSTGFAVRRQNGSVEVLHSRPTAWAVGLATDGNNYTWQELNGGVLELWTSPFTKPVAAFQPTLVRVVEGTGGKLVAAAFGEGWWVYYKDIDTLRAVRISDGHWVDMPPPKDKGWIEPFAVVDGEVWANVQHVPGTSNGVSSIVRVPIAALGTPKP